MSPICTSVPRGHASDKSVDLVDGAPDVVCGSSRYPSLHQRYELSMGARAEHREISGALRALKVGRME